MADNKIKNDDDLGITVDKKNGEYSLVDDLPAKPKTKKGGTLNVGEQREIDRKSS